MPPSGWQPKTVIGYRIPMHSKIHKSQYSTIHVVDERKFAKVLQEPTLFARLLTRGFFSFFQLRKWKKADKRLA